MPDIYVGKKEFPAGEHEVILTPYKVRSALEYGEGMGEDASPHTIKIVDVPAGKYEVKVVPVKKRPAWEYGEGGGKAKKSKAKSKGTRKLSPYMKFVQEVRPKLIKEDPKLRSDIPGIGRRIGEMWRGLTAEEKAKY